MKNNNRKFQVGDIVTTDGWYSFDPTIGIIVKSHFGLESYDLRIPSPKFRIAKHTWPYQGKSLNICLTKKKIENLNSKQKELLLKLLSR